MIFQKTEIISFLIGGCQCRGPSERIVCLATQLPPPQKKNKQTNKQKQYYLSTVPNGWWMYDF